MTVNVTLVVAPGSFVFETVQRPVDPVVHDAVPPLLHDPVTTTPATAAWVEVWIPAVTWALQREPFLVADRSRSPTWKGVGGAPTVTVTVAASVPPDGSPAV
ncbi:MAG: hypothetical protein HW391_977 [Chloroflexi bacterium]|nr:hypothetical protein [Chloroflexota bacterium]